MQADRAAKSEREQKEAETKEKAWINKARLIVKNCETHKIPCNLAEFGFDFTVSELKQVDSRNWTMYKITGDSLKFYEMLNRIRNVAA